MRSGCPIQFCEFLYNELFPQKDTTENNSLSEKTLQAIDNRVLSSLSAYFVMLI
jgi:hypothetical protein